MPGQGIGIVLKMRIADGAARVHDAGTILSTDIKIDGMVESNGMAIFMRSGGGCL